MELVKVSELTAIERRRIIRVSGLVCLALLGLTVICDLIGKSTLVTIPVAFAALIGLIASGIMYIMNRKPVEIYSVLLIPIAALAGVSVGILIISLY